MKRILTVLAALFLFGANEPKDADDLKKMQGDWMVVSMTLDGTKMPDEEAQILFRTIDGNKYSVFRYSKLVGQGTFKIDATQNPKRIESTPTGPSDKVKPILGIYEFDGERLRICNAPPGRERPTSFESKEGSEFTLIVWEREQKK